MSDTILLMYIATVVIAIVAAMFYATCKVVKQFRDEQVKALEALENEIASIVDTINATNLKVKYIDYRTRKS